MRIPEVFLPGFLSLIFLLPLYTVGQEKLLIPFRVDKQWGYANEMREIKISPVYDSVGLFNSSKSSGDYANVKQGNAFFNINMQGERVADTIKDGVSLKLETMILGSLKKYKHDIEEYLFFYTKDGMLGIKYEKDTLVGPKFVNFGEYSNGLASLKTKKGWALYDSTGRRLSSTYDSLSEIRNNFIIVMKNNKYGLIDKTGKVIIKRKYQHLESVSFKSFVARKRGAYGLIDSNEKLLVPYVFSRVNTLPYRRSRCYLFYGDTGSYVYINDKGERFEQ
jgi:hypothetical protein